MLGCYFSFDFCLLLLSSVWNYCFQVYQGPGYRCRKWLLYFFAIINVADFYVSFSGYAGLGQMDWLFFALD